MTERLLVILLLLVGAAAIAQGPAPADLDEVVRRVDASRQGYLKSFQDLIAIETRTTELLDKRGQTGKQRTIVSDFLVYRSKFDPDAVRELRIARDVDGRVNRQPTEEAMRLFRALSNTRSPADEDRVLVAQNAKRTLRLIFVGLTLSPVPPVRLDLRHDFDFSISGREQLRTRDTIVLVYQPKELRPADPNHWTVLFKHFNRPRWGNRGRIWIDAEDWRIHKWVDEMLAVDDAMASPGVVMRKEMDFDLSSVGIVPKRITLTAFDKDDGKGVPRTLRPVTRLIYDYEDFKRVEVSTTIQIKTPRID